MTAGEVSAGSSGDGDLRSLSTEYLRALPKAEVHCHLEGCVPPELAAAIAQRNGARLPPARIVDGRYRFESFEEGLATYVGISRAMRTPADFELVAYQSLVAAAAGGLRYREIAFNPQNHDDLTYDDMVHGILAGARRAHDDAGVTTRLIVAINREHGGEAAEELIREVVSHPHEEVVGIGLDHHELAARPSEFVAAFDLARAAGLRLSAHAGEHGDAGEITECLDALGIDRIDHGYAVLRDPGLLARTAAAGIPYTACWYIDHPDAEGRRRDVAAMAAAGLVVCLNSDDPGLIGPEIGDDFVDAAMHGGWGVEDAERYALAGLDACFADEATISRLRGEFDARLREIRPFAYAGSPADTT